MNVLKSKWVQFILAGLVVYFTFPLIGLGPVIQGLTIAGIGAFLYLKK